MDLRFRYALSLLFVLILLIVFSAASVYLLYKGKYIFLLPLLGALYLITFNLGKSFSKIFFTLSFLRYIRNQQGVASMEQYKNFIYNALTAKQKHRAEPLQEEILSNLIKDEIISVQEEKIYYLKSN